MISSIANRYDKNVSAADTVWAVEEFTTFRGDCLQPAKYVYGLETEPLAAVHMSK